MAESKLKIDVRRNKILEQLRKEGKVSVSRLAVELGATPVTIRNDLTALERDGYLVRMQGGAVISHRSDVQFNSSMTDDAFLQKQALAQQVAAMVADGETLFFNSGTTTLHIARALKEKKYLNIVTNSLAIAMELGPHLMCCFWAARSTPAMVLQPAATLRNSLANTGPTGRSCPWTVSAPKAVLPPAVLRKPLLTG